MSTEDTHPVVTQDQCKSDSDSARCCYAKFGKKHADDCRLSKIFFWNKKVPFLDLRSVSRDSDRCVTEVNIVVPGAGSHPVPWIKLGSSTIREGRDTPGEAVLLTHGVAGITDMDHSSVYVMSLPLIGFRFSHMLFEHQVVLSGWVDPAHIDYGTSFRVPPPGYDPLVQEDDVYMCDCEGEDGLHPIVYAYVPKHDRTLFGLVRSKKVEVVIRPVFDYDGDK